ncbi:hypothetical protein CCR75_003805 [Bremia lactucae]|uniref:PX domain-containing protein n=1 Tax=Bremia lactucae TaxID=4779 RepID=A0A976FK56_BRELC|nr:hypothetical protein CCR75_003805 [Bremia lactucae]
MTEASIQSQRLRRLYEASKISVHISTRMALADDVGGPVTMYHMDICFRSTRNRWSIAKRFSDFYSLRQQLFKWCHQFKQQRLDSVHFGLVLAVNYALQVDFPRRHFRNDNYKIIERRRVAFAIFVPSLVKILASTPFAMDSIDYSSFSTMTANIPPLFEQLFTILCDFLEFSDKHFESETKLKLTVLSLQDVIESTHSVCSSEGCSICLGEWDDDECFKWNVVQLPCKHAFHE